MVSDDVPAWELDQENVAIDRQPKGYLDLLTWQSRRIKLIPGKNRRSNHNKNGRHYERQSIPRWFFTSRKRDYAGFSQNQ